MNTLTHPMPITKSSLEIQLRQHGVTQATPGAAASSSSGSRRLTGLSEQKKHADVIGVQSPERATLIAPTYRLKFGSSFDLTNGWGLAAPLVRRQCWEQIKRESSLAIIFR